MLIAALALTFVTGFGDLGAGAAQATPDYADPAHWLCLPGRADACDVRLDTAVIHPDGEIEQEPFRLDAAAPIDCFYLYPTVSRETSGNADMAIDREVRRAAALQFARFGAVCRLFAPVYRQVTFAGMISGMRGGSLSFSADLAYEDIAAAWRAYLAHHNQGRGFVLIGHSQGASLLTRLIREEIDGKPIAARLVSAILMGVSLPVRPEHELSIFPHTPACHASSQTGCIVAFASFRAESPPPPSSLFVWTPPGMRSACVNPAAIEGGEGPLDSRLSASGATIFGEAAHPPAWTDPPHSVGAPFVALPGLLSARCVQSERGAYLAITQRPGSDDKRTRDIAGDLVLWGRLRPEWGLHLIDAELTIGNLVRLVAEQSRAYLAQSIRP